MINKKKSLLPQCTKISYVLMCQRQHRAQGKSKPLTVLRVSALTINVIEAPWSRSGLFPDQLGR